MTAINLLECLEEFVKEKTADIKLQVKVRNRNPQEVKVSSHAALCHK